MNNSEKKIKGMLLGTIIGDALGTPLNGLSKAHVLAVFKSIDNYVDPTPALKSKLQTWRKPGLYSSISQLMILLSLHISTKRWKAYDFIRLISNTPESAESEFGIFRHHAMTRHLIKTAKSSDISVNEPYSSPCSIIALILISIVIQSVRSYEMLIINILSFALIFSRDVDSAAGSLMFNLILRRILYKNDSFFSGSILSIAVDELNLLLKSTEVITAKIFELGMNPDYLLSSIKDYLKILIDIKEKKDIDNAEKIIFNYLNTKIKTPVTRATVNHPLAIIPYSIYFADFFSKTPSEILYRAAESGGATSILCALIGALTGASRGTDWIQKNLLNELINKKRILNIVDAIIREKVSDELIQEFIQNEASITEKEIQEKNAKLKHVKIKVKKKKSPREVERELSSHIVESWTKIDKAKWRKKLDKKEYE